RTIATAARCLMTNGPKPKLSILRKCLLASSWMTMCSDGSSHKARAIRPGSTRFCGAITRPTGRRVRSRNDGECHRNSNSSIDGVSFHGETTVHAQDIFCASLLRTRLLRRRHQDPAGSTLIFVQFGRRHRLLGVCDESVGVLLRCANEI